MSPLPETLVHYRTDLEEAIGREQAARLRQGRRRQRLVALVAGILVVGLLVTPAFGIGGRLLALIESAPGRPDVQAPVWSPGGRQIAFLSRRDGATDLRRERRRERAAEADARREARHLLPGRPTGGRSPSKAGRRALERRLCRERRRKRAAEAGAQRERSCLVARRADDRVLQRLQDLPHERRRERAPGPDEAAEAGRSALLRGRPTGGSSPSCARRLRPGLLQPLCREQRRERTAEPDGEAGPPAVVLVSGPASDPAWSPDGQTIAFVRLNASLGEPIYVVKADGSGLRNLTPKPVGAYAAPAWSPDGRKIAFVSDRDGNSEVYVMNANGSGQRNLTRNPAFDADPAWSPDGRKIAFVSNRDGSYGVYVMNADGSGQRRLAQRSP